MRLLAGTPVAIDSVRRGNLVETVVASGHVETPYRVEIASQITGTVTAIPVREGQSVTQGQLLIALDPHELDAAVVQAEGGVAQAQAHMRQLKELTLPSARDNRKAAQANLLIAQKSFDRASALVTKGFETRAFLDDAQKTLDVARALARTAESQVYTASPAGSDYVTGQTELAQAIANLATARSRREYANIRAPRDGTLISRSVERGTVADAGKVLMVLAPGGVTQLVLQIDERNIGKIALGQPALASADAYPAQRFDATVAYINPGIDIARASIQMKLDVAKPPAYLRQDMTVSVDIEVARRNDVLVAPIADVRDALAPQPWVMVVRGGRAVHQPVKLGLEGTSQTQIVSGVGAGEQLIPASSNIVAGARVRPTTS
ncbi:efflux RND transporter periplasmic adaptor subunit [Polymorphobacter arshaanensis]|nr:efflux RND transporter periplasmic adaptor subunit [Polymorphobacter arshaanensis]